MMAPCRPDCCRAVSASSLLLATMSRGMPVLAVASSSDWLCNSFGGLPSGVVQLLAGRVSRLEPVSDKEE